VSSFSERLRQAREALGWRPEEAAAIADVSRATIYNWEAGGDPSAGYLMALVGEGVSPDYLLRGRLPIMEEPPEDIERRFRAIQAIARGDDADAIDALLDELSG
jgi:transcriptional regulator with XRE-family HTH domain